MPTSTDLNSMPEEQVRGEMSKQDALRREIVERFKHVKNHYADWDKVAREDYQFALGDQWTEEEKRKLEDESRPCLTFNRIRSLINLIAGYQRENQSRIKVNPEGGEDRVFSEVMDRGIKAMDKWSHMTYKFGYWFDDGCYVGKGWLEAVMNYDKDPIRGELKFKQLAPNGFLPDPNCKEYDINEGARYGFKPVKLTKEELKELYPGKAHLVEGFIKDDDNRILNGDTATDEDWMMQGSRDASSQDDDYGNDKEAQSYQTMAHDRQSNLEKDVLFTVREYWRFKRVMRYFVIDKDSGEPQKFEKKEEAEKFIADQEFGEVVDRRVPEMWVAAFCCGWILDDQISPFEPHYSGYPQFRFLADWAPNAEKEVWRVQGITRPLKDPQREKNKSKSQYLHITNTQANSGWIGDKDALSPAGWKQLEKIGSKPGITIKKKKGTELREIQPKLPNQSHLLREQQADEEFKQISGVNPDLLGFSEKTSSGRAISMRIRQAVLSLVRLFYNYRYSKEIVGNFLLKMMPALFDSQKLIKVLGPQYMRDAVDKERYPEGLKKGHVDAFLQMVKDSKYDVYVAEADANQTIRFEIFQELTELLKAGAPIPIELIVDYMDLPNSQEVKDKIKEAQEQAAAQAAAENKK